MPTISPEEREGSWLIREALNIQDKHFSIYQPVVNYVFLLEQRQIELSTQNNT